MEKTSENTLNVLKGGLIQIVKKYFKEPHSIEICISQENVIGSYIMEKPKFQNCEDDITGDLTDHIHRIYPKAEVSVNINYAAFFPDFHPQKYIAGEPIKAPERSKNEPGSQEGQSEFDYERLSENYQASMPHYSFEQVILPENTKREIEEAIGVLEVEEKEACMV